jgi:hypothetical protein
MGKQEAPELAALLAAETQTGSPAKEVADYPLTLATPT